MRNTLGRLFKNNYVVLALIVFLGLVLRLINLGEPFAGDEILSLDIARQFSGLKELYAYLSLVETTHPPLYYTLLHFWIPLAGAGEAAVRVPSLISGLIVIILTYLLGKTFFGDSARAKKIGLLAAFLVAILSSQIAFTQQARPYVILTVFILLSVFSLWRYLESKKYVYLAGYIIFSLLSLYLHYSFILFFIPLSAYWLIVGTRNSASPSREFIIWLVSHTFIALGFFFWLDIFIFKIILGQFEIFGFPRNGIWLTPRELYIGSEVFDQLIWYTKGQPVEKISIIAVLLVKLATLGVFIWYLLTHGLDLKQKLRGSLGRPLGFLLWVIIGASLLFIVSPFSMSYTITPSQHIFTVSVFLAIMFAWFLSELRPRLRWLLLIFFLVSQLTFVATVVGDDGEWQRSSRVKFTAEFINDGYRARDLVLVEFPILRSDFNHYLRSDVESHALFPPSMYDIDEMRTRATLGLAEHSMHFRIRPAPEFELKEKMSRLVDRYEAKRVWLAYFPERNAAVDWLEEAGWRPVFRSPTRTLLPLDLFAAPGDGQEAFVDIP